MKSAQRDREFRVLVVEDVDEMRLFLEQFLARIPGIRVSGLASTIREARLEVSRRRPDLVFLDEVMPGESSSEFLEELHRDGMSVILLTSLENPTHPLLSGALARLIKPGWRTTAEDLARFEKEISRYKSSIDGSSENC